MKCSFSILNFFRHFLFILIQSYHGSNTLFRIHLYWTYIHFLGLIHLISIIWGHMTKIYYYIIYYVNYTLCKLYEHTQFYTNFHNIMVLESSHDQIHLQKYIFCLSVLVIEEFFFSIFIVILFLTRSKTLQVFTYKGVKSGFK